MTLIVLLLASGVIIS